MLWGQGCDLDFPSSTIVILAEALLIMFTLWATGTRTRQNTFPLSKAEPMWGSKLQVGAPSSLEPNIVISYLPGQQ